MGNLQKLPFFSVSSNASIEKDVIVKMLKSFAVVRSYY